MEVLMGQISSSKGVQYYDPIPADWIACSVSPELIDQKRFTQYAENQMSALAQSNSDIQGIKPISSSTILFLVRRDGDVAGAMYKAREAVSSSLEDF